MSDEGQLPPVTEVARLTIRPGDRVIVKLGAGPLVTDAVAERVKARVRATLHLPASVPLLVITGDMDVTVAGTEDGS